MRDSVVITCEHGGNRIPAAYRALFDGHERLLATHRGYDPGALAMARALARALDAPLVASTTSRLLVDLNRSAGHRRLHFDSVRNTPRAVRARIVAEYYEPYRQAVERELRQAIARYGRVIHLSSHSFTPRLDGEVRTADVGLLYDPSRPLEAKLCSRWKAALEARAPQLVVRRNYPYAGTADGFTTWFRHRLPATAYVGVELEINQKHVFAAGGHWAALRKAIVASLQSALAGRSETTTSAARRSHHSASARTASFDRTR